jgi:virulence-associated protein VapD
MFAIAFDIKKSVRDIRAFRVEDWSDFTAVVTEDEK